MSEEDEARDEMIDYIQQEENISPEEAAKKAERLIRVHPYKPTPNPDYSSLKDEELQFLVLQGTPEQKQHALKEMKRRLVLQGMSPEDADIALNTGFKQYGIEIEATPDKEKTTIITDMPQDNHSSDGTADVGEPDDFLDEIQRAQNIQAITGFLENQGFKSGYARELATELDDAARAAGPYPRLRSVAKQSSDVHESRRLRDTPVADILRAARDKSANILLDFKTMPKDEFIDKYGKEVYDKLLGFTPAQAGKTIKKLASAAGRAGGILLENAGTEKLKQTPTATPVATVTHNPEFKTQSQILGDQTLSNMNDRTILKESLKGNVNNQPDNLLILDALKTYLDSLPDEADIDAFVPSDTAKLWRRIHGVDVLINRALEKLSGGDRAKRHRILELLETEKHGRMYGLQSFIEDNPEYDKIIEASISPRAHQLLGEAEQADLEWESLQDEEELRQIVVSSEMLSAGDRLAKMLGPIGPTLTHDANCGCGAIHDASPNDASPNNASALPLSGHPAERLKRYFRTEGKGKISHVDV